MKINIEVDLLEKNEKDLRIKAETITIESHWNYEDLVILVIDGNKYTVHSDFLIKAIKRATNWRW